VAVRLRGRRTDTGAEEEAEARRQLAMRKTNKFLRENIGSSFSLGRTPLRAHGGDWVGPAHMCDPVHGMDRRSQYSHLNYRVQWNTRTGGSEAVYERKRGGRDGN
jgi:hypothetical protein